MPGAALGRCPQGPSLTHCLLSAGPGCWALWVEPGPPSVTVSVGEQVRLQCPHNGSSNTNVTWWHVLQVNSSWPPVMYPGALGPKGELIIQQVNKSHRGMYRCQVSEGKKMQRSCGTYLRVRGECPSRPSSGKAGWSPSLHRLHLGHPGSRQAGAASKVSGLAGGGVA